MINKKRFIIKKNGEPDCKCFCRNPELIENYDKAIADKTQMYDCHHRKEEFYSQKELKERNEYLDVPPEDLIFLTHKEHCKIDSYCKRNSEAKSKKVLCLETSIVFDSITAAYRKTGIHYSSISQVCGGHRKTAGGYHWKFV